MSTTTKLQYGSATAITCSLASLGSYLAQEGANVDNTTTAAVDYQLSGKIKIGAAAPKGDIEVLLGSTDGNNWTDPATGSNAAIPASGNLPCINLIGGLKPGDKLPGTNLRYLGRIQALGHAGGSTLDFMFESLLPAFKSGIPLKWNPIFLNCDAQALDSTGGNHAVYQTAITYQNA